MNAKNVKCPVCDLLFPAQGLASHMRSKHPSYKSVNETSTRHIGRKIALYAKQHKISIPELAKKMGRCESTVYRYLTQPILKKKVIKKICEALQVPVSTFSLSAVKTHKQEQKKKMSEKLVVIANNPDGVQKISEQKTKIAEMIIWDDKFEYYLTGALAMQDVAIKGEHLSQMIDTIKLLMMKGTAFSLRDASIIKSRNKDDIGKLLINTSLEFVEKFKETIDYLYDECLVTEKIEKPVKTTPAAQSKDIPQVKEKNAGKKPAQEKNEKKKGCPILTCPVCFEMFKTTKILLTHMRIKHRKELKFVRIFYNKLSKEFMLVENSDQKLIEGWDYILTAPTGNAIDLIDWYNETKTPDGFLVDQKKMASLFQLRMKEYFLKPAGEKA